MLLHFCFYVIYRRSIRGSLDEEIIRNYERCFTRQEDSDVKEFVYSLYGIRKRIASRPTKERLTLGRENGTYDSWN